MNTYEEERENAIEIYTYKDGEVEEIGALKDSYQYLNYSKEGKVLIGHLRGMGKFRIDMYQWNKNKISKVAYLYEKSYEDVEDELPKGKFKKEETIYCYTETNQDTQYYTEKEFEHIFQKKYKVPYHNFLQNAEEIWNEG